MRKIIISYNLYGKGAFCAAWQQELPGTGQCASVRLCQGQDRDWSLLRLPGKFRLPEESCRRKTCNIQVIFSHGQGYSGNNYLCRLVSSEKGHLLFPKDSCPSFGDANEGHKLECLPAWVYGFSSVTVKNEPARDII